MFPCLSLFSLFPPTWSSNIPLPLLQYLTLCACVAFSPPPRFPPFSLISSRRASPSWPSRGTSWGPTQPFSPRNTRTPARMQPERPTPPSAGTTWRVQKEGATQTATGPSTAPEATSGRTTEAFFFVKLPKVSDLLCFIVSIILKITGSKLTRFDSGSGQL